MVFYAFCNAQALIIGMYDESRSCDIAFVTPSFDVTESGKLIAIERDNKGLDACLVELKKILKRWEDIGITDQSKTANQEAMFVRQLRNMILYAMVITKGARMRDESRGAHAKIVLDEKGERVVDENNDLVFMGRDDENFMRITVVSYDPKTEEPQVTYREFDHSLIKPRLRSYK